MLTQDCVLTLSRQRVTVSQCYESQILWSQTTASVTIMMLQWGFQNQPKTNSVLPNHAGSMLLMFWGQWYWCDWCHSSSLRIFTSRSSGYRTTPEILVTAVSDITRQRQDYTWCVTLKECAHWSRRSQCLALISLGDSHPFATKHTLESLGKRIDTERWLSSYYIFPFPYLVLHFSIFHLPRWETLW